MHGYRIPWSLESLHAPKGFSIQEIEVARLLEPRAPLYTVCRCAVSAGSVMRSVEHARRGTQGALGGVPGCHIPVIYVISGHFWSFSSKLVLTLPPIKPNLAELTDLPSLALTYPTSRKTSVIAPRKTSVPGPGAAPCPWPWLWTLALTLDLDSVP